MPGLKLAALYGFYPHRLGFCGLQEDSAKRTLLDYLSGKKISEQKIRRILETFQGAFSYYKLIAKSNGIEDPFDEKVVRAYWLGNELLEKVSIDSLREMIIKEFSGPGLLPKKLAEKKSKEIPFVSKPHHSFHVLVIGSVTGRIALEDKLVDICRVGWGKVVELGKNRAKNKAIIEYQPLCKREQRYFLGEPVQKSVFWDKILIPELKIGDMVSTHWNHIIQFLNQNDLSQLKKYTWATINSLSPLVKKC